MARVFFGIQAVVLILLGPLFPGFPSRLYGAGLVLLCLVVGIPVLAACCVWSVQAVGTAFRDAFGYRRLGSGSRLTLRIWEFLVGIFPLTGFGAFLLAGMMIADNVGSTVSGFILLFVALAWVGTGFSLFSLLRGVVIGLSSRVATVGDGDVSEAYARHCGLTPREVEVADLLVRGLSYREIGERLFISPSTAKTHVLHVYQKTGAASRHELVRFIQEENPGSTLGGQT